MFSLIKTAFSGILSKVMLVSLLGLGAFSLYQFWENGNINKKLVTSNNNLTILTSQHDLLKGQYKDLEVQLKQLQSSAKSTNDVLDANAKTKIIYNDRFDLVDQRVNAQVSDIRKKYADKERNAENKKAEELEVSTVRVKSLWDSFCVGNSSEQCSVKK